MRREEILRRGVSMPKIDLTIDIDLTVNPHMHIYTVHEK